MSMLSRLPPPAALITALLAIIWLTAVEAQPRNEIKVAPYRAAEDAARRTALQEFRGILFHGLQNRALSLYIELLEEQVDNQHIAHLSDVRDTDIEDDDIRTFNDALQYIRNFGSLAILSGTLNQVGEGFEFRSNIYVDTSTDAIALPVRPFKVVYLENAGTANEMEAAHLFVFLYALTVDAASHDLPVPVIRKLQAATMHAFNDMGQTQQEQNQSAMDEIAGIR